MIEPNDKVSKYFTRFASTFDSLYAENNLSPLMQFINQHFRRDIYERYLLALAQVTKYNIRTVLDVGCGSGRYALGLSDLGVERVVGVDLSHKMIELAINNTRQIQNANKVFEFICSDFIEFNTMEQFDCVLAMGLFDYTSNPVPFLNKMKMLSKHLVISSFPSISIYRTSLRKIRYYYKQCPVYFYNTAMIRSFSAEVGFSSTSIIKIKGAGMDYFTTFVK